MPDHGAEVTVRGAAELRVKETDRIAALVAGLRALGIAADERPDGFVAGQAGRPGAARPTPEAITAWPWRLRLRHWPDSALYIVGADSVVISYPEFFDTLGRLVA